MSSLFTWPVRVYYEDTDAGGIVYYANYLKFFERARTEWLRAAGVGQQLLLDDHEAGAVFVKQKLLANAGSARIDYHTAARLDDEIVLTLAITKFGRASVVFSQQALRGEQLLAAAEVKVGCVDLATLRPRAFPDDAADKMRAT
jgi:acyl-CoA thioester hydrolase